MVNDAFNTLYTMTPANQEQEFSPEFMLKNTEIVRNTITSEDEELNQPCHDLSEEVSSFFININFHDRPYLRIYFCCRPLQGV